MAARSTCSSARSGCATRSRSVTALAAGEQTVPLAELVLTKLQIVELNEKDVRDTALLFYGHEVADRDGDAINGAQDRRAVRQRLGAVADDHRQPRALP